MKLNGPVITLLVGAALGISLLAASMLASSGGTTRYTGAAGPTASPTPAKTAATAAPLASAPPTQRAAVDYPARADYTGEVTGGGASVAISVHGTRARAYVCNGSVIEAWLTGTAVNGVLNLTGKNGARLYAGYNLNRALGSVVADGIRYTFRAPNTHRPAGLYQAVAVVRGTKIQAGWIVLPNGLQRGSIEPDANSPAPTATAAPPLNLATLTARDGSIILVAKPISGVAGSGF